jgi:hypothetical protein
MEGSCEEGNEPSHFMKSGKVLEQVSSAQERF